MAATGRLRRLALVTAGLAAAQLLVVLFLKNPATDRIFPPCPFLWLTGFYCPGCGALRAMHELLHLHFLRAFALNPLLVVSLPLMAGYTGYLLFTGGLRRPLPQAVYLSALSVIIAFWLLRNIPHYPFTLLAPH
ncbi:MAG: DUF2752 domain-containing protein [Leptospiraceae bacterium]|nr:DUF2752 domain-containing protein [Leptospiraceae bacterium]